MMRRSSIARGLIGLWLLLLAPCFAILGGAAGGSDPNPPANPSPPDASTNIAADPLLCVDVSDPEADTLEVEFFGRDLDETPAEDFTMVLIPDSEFYSHSYPQLFHSQTQWIVENRQTRNVVFVTHLGDIVHNPKIVFEWQNADLAMSRLEDPVTTTLADGIPYGIAVGNHDNFGSPGTLEDQYSGQGTVNYNETFGIDRFLGRGYYAGHFGVNNDNHYELFSAGGMDFIIFHLEYDPQGGDLRQAVLQWVEGLMQAHPDRRAIVSAHYILDPDGNFGDGTFLQEPGDQGLATWDALKNSPNLFLMLCAHLWNNPHRTDTVDGNTIHTLMANYQHFENGGNGWLRILTFKPADDEIQAQTYSTWIDEFWEDPVHEYALPYDMEGGVQFRPIDSASATPSGTTACVNWPGREPGGQYEWFVRVSDADSTTVGPRWSFESNGSCAGDQDCDDGNPCTDGTCPAGVCIIQAIPNCCVDGSDCDDENPCTDDLCQAGSCQITNNSAPCSDFDGCTEVDTCSDGICGGTSLDCNDGIACTSDSCDDGECEHDFDPSAGCCTNAVDCDDADPCTVDSCDGGGVCTNDPTPGCCSSESECDDGLPCTADGCSTNRSAVALDGLGAHVNMGKFGFMTVNTALNSAEFTAEVWFKWDGGGETTMTWEDYNDCCGIEAIPLVAKGRDHRDTVPKNDINYFLGILAPGNVLAADFEEHATGSSPGLNHPVVGTTPISTGVWHHAAVTYNGCCWQLYLDGQPETDGTNCPAEPPAFDSKTHFSIGTAQRSSGEASGAFSGLLDEPRIWSRALSPLEIQANMNQAIPYHPDLLGRWGLDERTGYVAVDSTGNDQNGKIVLTDWVTDDLPPPLGLGSCASSPIPACCENPADCDDANACTTDSCTDARCDHVYAPTPGCCLWEGHCADGDPCTDAICDGTGTCSNPALDTDGDWYGDCVDADDDNDGLEDSCDNCPAIANPDQRDADLDFEGDLCDSNDGVIVAWFENTGTLQWQEEPFDSFNAYSGDLAILDSTGVYTQAPGSNPLAAQNCGASVPLWQNVGDPPTGSIAFFLVSGVTSGVEGSLGPDSTGAERTNDNACLP